MVKHDEIIHLNVNLVTLGSLPQKGNYFLSARVLLTVNGLYIRVLTCFRGESKSMSRRFFCNFSR